MKYFDKGRARIHDLLIWYVYIPKFLVELLIHLVNTCVCCFALHLPSNQLGFIRSSIVNVITSKTQFKAVNS